MTFVKVVIKGLHTVVVFVESLVVQEILCLKI